MIDVIIIGGGIAGMEAACTLHDFGFEIIILEKDKHLGGHLQNWDTLFPTKRNASEVLDHYVKEVQKRSITVYLNTDVTSVTKQDNGSFEINTSREVVFKCKTVLMTTGYDLFNAERKEEYGYKIYDNVITSADLEKLLQTNKGELRSPSGNPIKSVAFVHCVGSRDEKSGNHYCSNVCCVTGVKQAIKMRQLLPEAQVFNFYMDLRMYGAGFEEMYREAQEVWRVQFIRGRLSEVAETIDKRLQVKAEDTLSARPLRMHVDLLVLLVGMEASKATGDFAQSCNLACAQNRFVETADFHIASNKTNVEGLFTAGCAIAPLSVFDTVNHAKAAALTVKEHLRLNN
ncbi:MAG: NAD(P)/FAD-dependent oxidoreductase [Bacteroidales bacterium]|jgi:heterodisulfide reductase subunit A|nr:NAD(P)/FAD-dependent oxidoreductase [Bacteroidales bacterium]